MDYSKTLKLLAIMVGILVPFMLPDASLWMISLTYLLIGIAFGFFQPKGTWWWGLWIAGPAIVLIGSSVLFSGHLDVFVQKDLPILVLGAAAACFGSYAGAQFRTRAFKKGLHK
jgi:hypothetical protein